MTEHEIVNEIWQLHDSMESWTDEEYRANFASELAVVMGVMNKARVIRESKSN